MALVGETETPQDWSALARAVTDRRVELGHRTLRAFAGASGLSTKTLGEIEGAKRSSYDRATLIQVERSLKWPPGSVLAILEQGARVVDGVVHVEEAPAQIRPTAGMWANFDGVNETDPPPLPFEPIFELGAGVMDHVTVTEQAKRLSVLAAALDPPARAKLERAVEAVMAIFVPGGEMAEGGRVVEVRERHEAGR